MNKKQLKLVIDNIINGQITDAEIELHRYIVEKSRIKINEDLSPFGKRRMQSMNSKHANRFVIKIGKNGWWGNKQIVYSIDDAVSFPSIENAKAAITAIEKRNLAKGLNMTPVKIER